MTELNKLLNEKPYTSDWVILGGYRGSIAHGTYVSSSDPNSIDDKDLMLVQIPTIDYFFGLKEFGSRGTKEIKRGEWDIVVYEFRKFINLLLKGNSNVLMMFWLEPKYYTKLTTAGEILLENRDLFKGRHVYRSFVGYAHGQLKRMTHYKFEGYMGTKRKQLVDAHGFDCKNASHLIRVLRMGIEFLRDGEMYVERYDAQELLSIKRGEWELGRVKEEADRLFKVAEEAYLKTSLPVGPDLDKVEDLCIRLVRLTLEERKRLI